MNYFFRVRIILYNQQVKDDRLKKYSFDFPEDFIEPIYFNIAEYSYHYGGDGFLYAVGKLTGSTFVLIDTEWHDVQDIEFNWCAMREDFGFDNSEDFDDDFKTSEN